MSTSHRLGYIAGPNRVLIAFLIQRDQYRRFLLGQVEINHADAAAFAFARYRPVNFTRACRAGNHFADQRIGRNPVNESQTLVIGQDFLSLFLKGWRFDDRAPAVIMRESRTMSNKI
jgi:hypothetical protein